MFGMIGRALLTLSLILFSAPAWAQSPVNARVQDGSGNLIASHVVGTRGLDVYVLNSTFAVTGTVTANIGTSGSLALDATLQSILTELGAKTEPADTQITRGPSDSATTGTIDNVDATCVASNSCVTVAVSGYPGLGVILSISSGTATIRGEVSTDGGTTYSLIQHFSYSQSAVVAGSVSSTNFPWTGTPFLFAGVTHYRLRATACVSCSVTAKVTLTTSNTLGIRGSESTGTTPTYHQIVGGVFNGLATLTLPFKVATAAPGTSDNGLIVRQVPNGATTPFFMELSDGAAAVGTSGNPLYVNANAGTNLNTSALALDATLTARFPTGAAPADNESNSANISRIGNYNFIYDGSTWDRWTGAITCSLCALESGGNLATLAGGVSGSKYQINVSQWNGATPSATNPVYTQPATLTPVSVSFNESVAALFAATWEVRRQWTPPNGSVFIPSQASSFVTTAGSRTFIGVGKSLGTWTENGNVFTDGGSVSSPNFYTRLFAYVGGTRSATANTITVTYTDDAGNTGNSATCALPGTALTVATLVECTLATTSGNAKDNGVIDVTAVSDSAAPANNVTITLYGMTAMHDTLGAANAFEFTQWGSNSTVPTTDSIFILIQQAATTAQQRGAFVTGAIK